ncbi:unnamed protein product [Cyprideis torosa]|uniref:Cap-specific mRNA (nucleoside-2'-O-)-methyltransferase 2 n=1 Tax=Cyprideis torosa TaxID=163714 RepID=A0A7R8W935_9CRUS|nr:unnamed protein product [Cyprideis torosa]CAG0886901.1 unnamed protein product [Cyprideis torosa]
MDLEAEETFDKVFEFSEAPPQFESENDAVGSDSSREEFYTTLKSLSESLTQCQSQLSAYPIAKWSQHTNTTDLSGMVLPEVRRLFNIEKPTRAWLKCYEILALGDILPSVTPEHPFKSFHLCEAPGAFVCALNHFLNLSYSMGHWDWTASSLSPYYEGNDASQVISSDAFILNTWKHWFFGVDGTGNIHQNVESLVEAAQGSDFITADGGIDCSDSPERQEAMTRPLLRSQIAVALRSLMSGGSFLLKTFTFFERETVSLLYLLSRSFQRIRLMKPVCSKAGNSELYLLCKGFRRCPPLNMLNRSASVEDTKFLQEVVRAAEYFSSLQQKKISSNVALFENMNPDKMKIVSDLRVKTAEQWIQKTGIKEIQVKDRIVPPRLRVPVFQPGLKDAIKATESIRHELMREIGGPVSSDNIAAAVQFLMKHVNEYFRTHKDMMSMYNGSDVYSVIPEVGEKPIFKIQHGPAFSRPLSSRFASPRTLNLWNLFLEIQQVSAFRETLLEENNESTKREFVMTEEITVVCPYLRKITGLDSLCICTGNTSGPIQHNLDLLPETKVLLQSGELKLLDRITVNAIAAVTQYVKEGEALFIHNMHLLTRLNVALILALRGGFQSAFLVRSQFACGILLIHAKDDFKNWFDLSSIVEELDQLADEETLTDILPLVDEESERPGPLLEETLLKGVSAYNEIFLYHLLEVILFGERRREISDQAAGKAFAEEPPGVIPCKETEIHVVQC